MKRILRIAVLTFVLAFLFAVAVSAAVASETESNNTRYTANKISLNAEYTGNISSSSDVDWYEFSLSSAGYVYVDFRHNTVSSANNYWRLKIVNSDGDDIAQGSYFYFRGDDYNTVSTDKLGLPAGTYYVIVESTSSYQSSVSYTLKVNYTASSVWETEENKTRYTADPVKLNTTYNGTVYASGDVDWYTFDLTSAGYVSVSFKHDTVSSANNYWRLKVLNSDGDDIAQGSYYYFRGDDYNTVTTDKLGLPAGTYYVMVESTSSYHSAVPYSFKVNYTASSVWETEGNATMYTADPVNLNTTYYGTIYSSGDVDWYTFKLTKTTETWLAFTHGKVNSSSNYWRVSLYKDNGSTYAYTNSYFYSAGGDTSLTTAHNSLPAGTYYVKVESSSNQSSLTYTLTVKCPETVPRITAIENVSTGVKLNWSKITSAAKYAVFRKGPGETSFKRIATTTSLTYTDKTAVSGKEYRYSVRAVSSSGTMSAYSTGQSIVYLKAPVISSVTNDTAGVKVSWGKVAGASK